MSEMRACPWCNKTVVPSSKMVPIIIDITDGASVAFQWHQDCAEQDELLSLMQQAMALPDHLAEEPVFSAYAALHMRTLGMYGADALQRIFHIIRDWPDLTITLKGPGKKWGVKSFA